MSGLLWGVGLVAGEVGVGGHWAPPFWAPRQLEGPTPTVRSRQAEVVDNWSASLLEEPPGLS